MRFSIVTSRQMHVVCLSSLLKEVFLARHAIFLVKQMYKNSEQPSDMHGTINVFLTTIHGPDHDIMQLLKI